MNEFHSLAISEQTSDVSTVLVSLPSTFLIISEEVLHAEVLLVIKVIISHYSFSSCRVISCLSSKVFPDSQIAQSFSCGATKCAYLACFGIYPYFHELLIPGTPRPIKQSQFTTKPILLEQTRSYLLRHCNFLF